MTYKAAIIGCGGRAGAHIEAYRDLRDATVVACCAPSSMRRDPLAVKYGLRAYADAAEMLERERPDIVHIVTWPHTRIELMTLVSEHDVPLCTVEKPIASGVADWRQLQVLCNASATRFAVCHQLRWHPNLLKCQRAFASGVCGKPEFLHISAGMNISGQGTHTLNYGRSLIGDPAVTRVFANASGWDESDPGHPAPCTTVAALEFETGLTALWTSGTISPRAGDPSTTWQHVRIAAFGDKGRVLFEEFGRWEIVGDGAYDGGHYGGMDGFAANNRLAQTGFHQAMFDWLTGDAAEPGTSLRQSLHEWAVVLAVYQSAVERRPISLQGFAPPDDLIERYRAAC
ncbi:MAG: Gfo/Idh/MocA family oxidoreductase [Capsulimonadaceae bacterium]|nr:Gfo/Idh/MocA family oxidoreductase [Capsulimonadaceae bacterium]